VEQLSVAEVIARACARRGVKRAFGVPGGGSCLDLIAAFERFGIEFHLCRTETGATLMASADAEIRNSFGVSIATQGPGAASAMNGLAHASLDRAPVLFISDGWTAKQSAFDTHQVFDQRAMSKPVVKTSSRMESPDPAGEIEALIDRMLEAPWGPVHIELTGENARRKVDVEVALAAPTRPPEASELATTGDVATLLRNAGRPVLLVGLEARTQAAAQSIEALAVQLNCPILTTYKAKGVISDDSSFVVGHFTGGAAEGDCIAQADLIILCGLDPVELIGKPWPYAAPVIDVAHTRHPVHYVEPAATLHGPLAQGIAALQSVARSTGSESVWRDDEIAALKANMRSRLVYPAVDAALGLSPQAVVETAQRFAGGDAHATVDAGAHMFSAMAFWSARNAGGALISNGLATMAYALPAAIARALHTPGQRVVAFTGDGGLMMCAGELATAAQHGANLCVIVFNDSALSLIALKQRNRKMKDAGVTWPYVDFASVARGFGLQGFTARTPQDYEDALKAAMATTGPCLIDVHVDPSGYQAQARALRG
jgi:acetolactate synthase-1/2/3 large subunit